MTLAVLCAAGGAWARPTRVVTLDEVVAYLHAATGGLIGKAPDLDPKRAGIHYLRSAPPRERFIPAAIRDPTIDQDVFTFDVDGFVAQQGARDFVDAKRRFYGRLPWSETEQKHQIPYALPAAWQTLNHPPVKRLDGPLSRWSDLYDGPPPETSPIFESPFFDPAFQRALDAASGTELTHGNQLTLLSNGEAYGAKLNLVRNARTRLYVAVMFWACDATSNALADAMIDRVRAGVDVRMITEGVYRETITRKCIDRLAMGGVKVWSSGHALQAGMVGSVMHWKVWIRDGEELILGGQNVLDYENHSDGFNLLNRDTDIRVRGPAVTDAERALAQEWVAHQPDTAMERVIADDDARMAAQRAARLRGADNYIGWLGHSDTRMQGNCRVAMQGPGARTQPIAPLVSAYLKSSASQVILSTPTLRYDVHDPLNVEREHPVLHPLTQLLDRAPGLGIPKVTILTNGVAGAIGESSMWIRVRRDGAWKARQWFLYRLARQYNEQLGRRASLANRRATVPLTLNPNVEVWTYFQYIHSKLWMFDRLATFVSSWNLETNSVELNHEAGILCLDASLRDRMAQDLTLAVVNSVPEDSAGVVR